MAGRLQNHDESAPAGTKHLSAPGRDIIGRAGIVCAHANAPARIVFDAETCPGCRGHCGFGLGASQLAVDVGANIPDGTRVDVTASAILLRRQALLVFGTPLAILSVAVAVAHFAAWSDWTVAGATLATLGATVVATRARANTRRGGPVRAQARAQGIG